MRVKNLKQTFLVKAEPERVYETLMNSRTHAAFTGYPARISPRVGGRFTTCGRRNSGVHLVLVPGRTIVAAWTHKDWPKHHFSIVSIRLKKGGKGTRVVFRHSGIPATAFRWVSKGWEETYWKPLRKFFRKAPAAKKR